MPIDHGDFLGAMQIGASIAERRMQLKAQAAMQALKEREMAQQADLLTQHAALYREQIAAKQAERLDEAALTQASVDLHKQFVEKENLTDEEATARTLAIMASRYPRQAQKLATAYAQVRKGQQEGKTTEHQAALEDLNQQRIALQRQREGRLAEQETDRQQRLVDREKRLSAKSTLDPVARARVNSIYKRIDRLTTKLDELEPESGFWNKKPNPDYLKLQKQIDDLHAEADAVAAPGKVKAPKLKAAAAQLKEGEVLMVSPEGKPVAVMKEDVEEALRNKFKEVVEGSDEAEPDEDADDTE